MANPLLDFVMSLVRDPDAAAQYAADPAGTIHAANLADVTSADVNALIPVVSESLSTAMPGTGAESLIGDPAGNIWSSGAATVGIRRIRRPSRRPDHRRRAQHRVERHRATRRLAARGSRRARRRGSSHGRRISTIRRRSSQAESSMTRRWSARPPTPTGSPSSTTRSTTWTPAIPDSTSLTSPMSTSRTARPPTVAPFSCVKALLTCAKSSHPQRPPNPLMGYPPQSRHGAP